MPLFVMIGHDIPNGSPLRDRHRADHLAHINALNDQGRIAFAGPIRNDANDTSIGAIIVFEANDLGAAQKVVDADPYVVGGVFESLEVAPFKRVFPAES